MKEQLSPAKQLFMHSVIGGGNLFDEKGIDLQITMLREIEQRALLAITVAVRPSYNEKIGKQVMSDVFIQSVQLFRRCNQQIGIVCLMRSELKDAEIIKAVIGHEMNEIFDQDEALSTLMRSVIHLWDKKVEEEKDGTIQQTETGGDHG